MPPDYDTMYAAGYLEGATSATRIGQSWINFWASTFPKGAEVGSCVRVCFAHILNDV